MFAPPNNDPAPCSINIPDNSRGRFNPNNPRLRPGQRLEGGGNVGSDCSEPEGLSVSFNPSGSPLLSLLENYYLPPSPDFPATASAAPPLALQSSKSAILVPSTNSSQQPSVASLAHVDASSRDRAPLVSNSGSTRSSLSHSRSSVSFADRRRRSSGAQQRRRTSNSSGKLKLLSDFFF